MKTTETIYEEMKEAFSEAAGLVVTPGGDMAIRLYAAAAQLASLWQQAEWTRRQCFPQTATGEDLEKHAALRGLSRGQAVYAEGSITFSIGTARGSAFSIDAGVTCTTAAGTAFVTTGAGSIPAGETTCTVPARAVQAGADGNVPAGSIVFLTLPPTGVVSCINGAAFTGGADEEDDEALRSRILASYRTLPNGANRAWYESAVRSIEGVAAVQVLPCERGAGTVDVVFSTPEGLPEADLVAEVQAKLSAVREICVDVQVSAPSGVSVDVEASVAARDGYDAAAVRADVESALRGYFSGERLGSDVLRAELGRCIYEVQGVANYELTEPASDVSIDADELPRLGTLTVSELG